MGALLTLFLCLFVAGNVVYAADQSSFWVEFADVGQGDCAIVQCDGHYMLIDGGPSKASSTVYAILKKKQIDRIDVIVATHPDEDHIGAISGALQYAKAEKIYSPVLEHDTKTFESMLKYVKQQGKKLTLPRKGESFLLGSATVELFTPSSAAKIAATDTNNRSIVVRICYQDTAFLFMGDAETPLEEDLILQEVDLSCDVLKVAHHGSDSSTSEAFLEYVSPGAAIISVGKDNPYKHPTKEVLSRLEKAGTKVYRTDLQGDIVCESDGKKVEMSVEKITTQSNAVAPGSEEVTFVLNKNTKRIHIPSCKSVAQMAPKNRVYSTQSYDEIIAGGVYVPCGNCHPQNYR